MTWDSQLKSEAFSRNLQQQICTALLENYGEFRGLEFVIRPYLPVRDGGYCLAISGSEPQSDRGSFVVVRLAAKAWLAVIPPLILVEVVILRSNAGASWLIPAFFTIYHCLGCILCGLKRRWVGRDFSGALEEYPVSRLSQN